MPGLAVMIAVVAMTFVTMDLNAMLTVHVGMRTMVMMSLVKPGTPLDLPKLGMQHNGQHIQVSQFQASPVPASSVQVSSG
jgi:methylaspartate ammonia-lyase